MDGKRFSLYLMLIFLALLSKLPAQEEAQVMELKLTPLRPDTKESQFVRGGIPFPRGLLKSSDTVRIKDDQGQQVKTQVKPLAFWPEGDIKWLFVDFETEPGKKYSLEYGDGIERKPFETTLNVKEIKGGVEVNTGRIKFTVTKKAEGFLGEVWLDADSDGKYAEDECIVPSGPYGPPVAAGKVKQRNFLNFLRLRDENDYPTRWGTPTGEISLSTAKVDSIEIEDGGPLRVCVLVRGKHINPGVSSTFPGRKYEGSDFTLRIEAYAGKSLIRVFHTFVYEGDPKIDFLQSMGLALSINLSDDKAARRIAVGGERRIEEWLYGNPLYASDAPTRPNPKGEFPVWRLGGILQETSLNYRTWKATTPTNASLTMDEGGKPAGWLDLSGPRPEKQDETWGVTCAIRNMWKLYPKEIFVDTEEASLFAYLYPPQSAPLDLRRYTNVFGTGEFDRFGPASATGVSKTHEVLFYFHPGGYEEANTEEVNRNFQEGGLFLVDPDWYIKSGAIGKIHIYDPENFPQTESVLADATDFMLENQKAFRWYGMLDYGDFQSVYKFSSRKGIRQGSIKSDRWMNDWGRWGWVNDEGLITFWLAMQFFRTGREDYLEAFSAMARHVRDVDTVHTRNTPRSEIVAAEPYAKFRYTEYVNRRGTGHRHNVQHWGDCYLGSRVSISTAQRLHYYLTGDGRTRDVIDVVYEFNVGPDHGKSIASTSSILYSLLTKWELSGDDKYQKMFAAFLEACYEYQEESGGYFPSDFLFDYLNRKRSGQFSGKAQGMFYHYFGFIHALLDYYELTGDERLKEAFIRLAEVSTEEEKKRGAYYLLFSIGYSLSGDEKYKELILQSLGRLIDRPFVPREREDWIGPRARTWNTSGMGFAIGGIPYAMEVIGSEEGVEVPEKKKSK